MVVYIKYSKIDLNHKICKKFRYGPLRAVTKMVKKVKIYISE